jgi:hypothetical protein
VVSTEDARRQYHAVTVVGCYESPDAPPAEIPVTPSHTLRSPAVSKIYVHDDRLGPYARMEWQRPTEGEAVTLKLRPKEPGFEAFEEPLKLRHIVVPLYPKLRLGADELLSFAGELLPLAKYLAGAEARDRVMVDMAFVLSGDYAKRVLLSGITARRAAQLVTQVRLSRYVGVIRYTWGTHWLDAVCDTTDIRRGSPAPLLVLIPSRDADCAQPQLVSTAQIYRAAVG